MKKKKRKSKGMQSDATWVSLFVDSRRESELTPKQATSKLGDKTKWSCFDGAGEGDAKQETILHNATQSLWCPDSSHGSLHHIATHTDAHTHTKWGPRKL